MRTSWLLILTCHEISGCKYELLMSAKTRWLYNTVAMEMFVVFNIPPFCSLDSFGSQLSRVFVHLNTIKKQGLSRDLRSPSAIFCLILFLKLPVVLHVNWRQWQSQVYKYVGLLFEHIYTSLSLKMLPLWRKARYFYYINQAVLSTSRI